MHRSFYIGNTEFCLVSEREIAFGQDLKEYLNPIMPIWRKVIYYIRIENIPTPFSFRYLTSIEYPPHIIGNSKTGECRIYRNVLTNELAAMYNELSDSEVELIFYNSVKENYIISLSELNYMAIERQLMKSKGVVLHSSFIVYQEKAILFTAPSGTGKSTQADLWKRYRNAEIMNGDRTLLVNTGDEWKAAGFPFSGSSGINHNGIYDIKAIVMIRQAKQNKGQIAEMLLGFKRIYPEIVRNYWNQEFEERVISFLNSILSKYMLIEYECNMEEDAVNCLEKLLIMHKEIINENN